MGRISETIKVLIIINVIFFIGTLLNQDLAYGLFSLFYYENPNFQFWQPLTHMFMHGGLWHILFNMYALWAFGTPLEMRWGRSKFLFFYFSAGLGAALVHTIANYYNFQEGVDTLIAAGATQADITEFLSNPANGVYKMYQAYHVPAVGASGAIYGILVAFAMMFPNIELMLIFLPIPIKAKYFVPVIILGDLIFGITGSPLGIAHWAHIGGALIGFIMAWYWKKNSFDNTRIY
ncbi:MAG: rhomboid family intramembrane serine protease [Bacteroidia bacterium]|nr:rhomboid family intramembrane serine protease [Bacteroidia bacterium]NNF30136.1 rhomboid family intramembrane serine protease [Flavobacteriaceae bacterium]MBT8275014.1 rhomboid family intramembrane serine protease [Bacteroidia bacterium]NNJ81804.1 rhomboid family intramembrane serine protease [Flavobacteriaceae bacterium]NNK55500.1 rhomboid family intramembrane serine protease [Flavobacteriaceae bacterium]